VKVSVIGPNGINDATFHIHKAGCRDIKRYGRIERPWDFYTLTVRDAVEELYSDFIDTGEGTEGWTWEDYAMDVRFFPCTEELE
jgi:hypothetical protein